MQKRRQMRFIIRHHRVFLSRETFFPFKPLPASTRATCFSFRSSPISATRKFGNSAPPNGSPKTKQHNFEAGQGALASALPLCVSYSKPRPRAERASQNLSRPTPSFFLLPRPCFSRSARGMLYARIVFSVVANQSFDSIRRMIYADSSDSKLCMVRPCHATSNFLLEIAVAQLGKGRAFRPSPLHPLPGARTRSENRAGFRATRLCWHGRVMEARS